MLSPDIFVFIETFLAAATSFAYSAGLSLVLLIAQPRTAPGILTARLNDKEVRQVGPLTLIALILGALIWSFTNSENKTFKGLFALAVGDSNTKMAVTILGATLAGTIILDGASRLVTFVGWPRTDAFAQSPEDFATRRTMANFAMIIPLLVWAIAASFLIGYAFVAFDYVGIHFSFSYFLAPLYYAAAMSLIPLRLAGVYFLKSFPGVRSAKAETRSAALVLREFYLPLTVYFVVYYAAQFGDLVGTSYSYAKPDPGIAKSAELEFTDLSCTIQPGNRIVVAWMIYNHGKGVATVYPIGKLALQAKEGSAPDIEKEFGTKATRIADAVVIASNAAGRGTIQIANLPITGTKELSCNVSLAVSPDGEETMSSSVDLGP